MTTAVYDGNGIRASSTIIPVGGSAVSQGYVWNTVAQMPELVMDSANAYIYGGSVAPTEQVNLSTGGVTYLVTDLLGSVRGTITSTGALAATTAYDAWGNPQNTGGLNAATPFGYAGGYTDPTGLIYLLNSTSSTATTIRKSAISSPSTLLSSRLISPTVMLTAIPLARPTPPVSGRCGSGASTGRAVSSLMCI